MEKPAFREVYAFDHLYEAHKKARLGKRGKEEVIRFESDLGENLARMMLLLKSGHYRMKPYNRFMVHDPKERMINAPSYADRVVQHSLCDNVIRPVLDSRLIYDNAASRTGKGTHFAMNRLSLFLRQHYREYGADGWILKFDIRHYFDSIDHEILKNRLQKHFGYDEKIMRLIEGIIDSYEVTEGKGLPLGNQTSQWFALFYLDGLDRLIKEHMRYRHYTRYMDDGVVLSDSRKRLKKDLSEMSAYIEDELKLSFNRKTEIVPMRQGVDYLGFHFYLTDTGKVVRILRQSNKRRMRRKWKHMRRAHHDGKIEIDAVTRSVVSYMGHLSHGNTYRLRRKLLEDMVLSRGE